MIPKLVLACASFGLLVCVLASLHSRNEVVLSDANNVPYFSTFLVPQMHFTRGGLHQAAASYEQSLKKQGIVDDDGVHYLDSKQDKQLAHELGSAIRAVLAPPRPSQPEEESMRPLTPTEDAKLAKSLVDTENYVFLANRGEQPQPAQPTHVLSAAQAIQLSRDLESGIRYVTRPAPPAKPTRQGLSLPQTKNLHTYLNKGLQQVFQMEAGPAPQRPKLPALEYAKGGRKFWNFIQPKKANHLSKLPAMEYSHEGREFWGRLHQEAVGEQAQEARPKLPALQYGKAGRQFWGKLRQPAAQARAAAAAAAKKQMPAIKYHGGSSFWKNMAAPRRSVAYAQPHILHGQQLRALGEYLVPQRPLAAGEAPGLAFAV